MDDGRGVSSEFQQHSFLAGHCLQHPPNLGAARKTEQPHPVVPHKLLGNIHRTGQHIEQTRRGTGFLNELPQPE